MSKLSRIVARIFGSGAGVDQIAQFGSLFAGAPAFTTDPAVAQALSNWLTGWAGAAIDGNAPAIEDMNAAFYVLAYQIAYQMQAGVPEWNTDTIYYIGSLATDSTGAIYVSRTDANTGNALSDPTNWKVVGGAVLSALGDIIYGGANGGLTRLAGSISAVPAILTQTGDGINSAAPAWRSFQAPTVQKFLSGSGTYTLPSSPAPLYIRVRLIGGGGGGSGSGTSGVGNGGSGGATTFGTTLLSGAGGTGGVPASDAGTGGAASLGSGPIGIAIAGGGGQPAPSDVAHASGGSGASSPFGGAGPAGRGSAGAVAGIAAAANSGSGGGGAGGGNTTAAGSGGGSGGYVDAVISAPSSTYSYAVGAAGAAGAAGTGGAVGGAGAAGVIIVEEFYQ